MSSENKNPNPDRLVGIEGTTTTVSDADVALHDLGNLYTFPLDLNLGDTQQPSGADHISRIPEFAATTELSDGAHQIAPMIVPPSLPFRDKYTCPLCGKPRPSHAFGTFKRHLQTIGIGVRIVGIVR